MVRLFKKINKYIPVASMVFVLLGIAAAAVSITATFSPAFADSFNSTVSPVIRKTLAYATSVIPFSLSEFILLSSPVIIIITVAVASNKAARGKTYFIRVIAGLVSFIILIYSMFVFCIGIGYKGSRLDEKLGIERADVSANDLYTTTCIVVQKLNELENSIIYINDRGSLRPFSHSETVDKCIESYDKLSAEYAFIDNMNVPVKQLVVSDIMTYTHISGVYTFFTGESNLNTNYPYFINVFTTAHEMAHQRGISREDEANFIAYLVCIGSDDEYVQYAGYLNMYEYLADALYEASPELYRRASGGLEFGPRYDLRCYSNFFDKYRDSVASEISDSVNDAYLKFQGTEGSRSYGMVVDLAVAYYKAAYSQPAEG